MSLFRGNDINDYTIKSDIDKGESPGKANPPLHLDPIRRLIAASELVLLATITICAAVLQSDKINTYGISYFGVKLKTLPIVASGFISGGALLVTSARKITPSSPPWKLLRTTLNCVGFGIILLLLTPYTVDTFFNWSHMIIGAVIFATEMYTGTVITLRFQKDKITVVALIVEFIGGLLSMFSLPNNMLNVMFEGEVIFQIGFMIILNRTLSITAPIGIALNGEIDSPSSKSNH